jgi:16S rRNA (cytosine1402-N4)-methyltransferase
VPVMLREVLHAVRARASPPTSLLDCTFGHGGHTAALLDAFPSIQTAVAFDRDEVAMPRSIGIRTRFPHTNFKFINAPFSHARRLTAPRTFDVVIADLGFASSQVDDAKRGFSFQLNDSPLDMRYSQVTQALTAAHIVNERSVNELVAIFRAYSGEHHAMLIAKAIVEYREGQPFRQTKELATCIFTACLGSQHSETRNQRVEGAWHSVRRVFQSLRIAVNEELVELDNLLRDVPDLLAHNGTLLMLSFHSLEHAAIKKFLDHQCGRDAERERARLAACLEARNPGIDAVGIMDAMERDGKIALPARRDASFSQIRIRKPCKEEIAANRRCISAQLSIATRINAAADADTESAAAAAAPVGTLRRKRRSNKQRLPVY